MKFSPQNPKSINRFACCCPVEETAADLNGKPLNYMPTYIFWATVLLF
jgi:hypothetical protein